jgi:hypothetical protein
VAALAAWEAADVAEFAAVDAVWAALAATAPPSTCDHDDGASSERKATAEIGRRIFTGSERRFRIDLRSPWSSKTQGQCDPFFASGRSRMKRPEIWLKKTMTGSSLCLGSTRCSSDFFSGLWSGDPGCRTAEEIALDGVRLLDPQTVDYALSRRTAAARICTWLRRRIRSRGSRR